MNPTIPHRFRDPFEPEPWARGTERIARGLRRDQRVVDRLRSALTEGDPEADALVEWMHSKGMSEGRRLFDRALERGIQSLPDAEPPLRDFFRAVDAVPAWLDRRQLVRACKAYDRTALPGVYVLFSVSLLAGYASAGIAKTLVGTGALERMAPRRLAETSKFVDDVYRSRTLERFDEGFKTTVRVRVMHALVRRHLLEGGWDSDRWGLPINQADMAATILQFSSTYIMGLRGLGVILPRKDCEAMTHFWRYVGRLSGVSDDLLPATAAEGRQLLRLSAASQQGPDADSRALAQALLAVPMQRARTRSARWFARADTAFCAGLARLAVGPVAADALGLPDTPWKYAAFAIAPVGFGLEALRVIVPGATGLMQRFGRSLSERRTRRWLEDRAPSFVPTVSSPS